VHKTYFARFVDFLLADTISNKFNFGAKLELINFCGHQYFVGVDDLLGIRFGLLVFLIKVFALREVDV